MLTAITALELGRLRVSLGYGTHKKGRPLSPMEVAALLRRACDGGHTLAECASVIRIHETGLARFLRVLDLPEDLQHLVDWGRPKDMIGFSSATEVVRVTGGDNQRVIAGAVLEHRLSSREVRQVAQLIARSGRSVGVCLREVLGMRPKIERRYIFIGSIADEGIRAALNERSQRERDAILALGMGRIGLVGGAGRLGVKSFTLVGNERFGASMTEVGRDRIEGRLLSRIAEALENAEASR